MSTSPDPDEQSLTPEDQRLQLATDQRVFSNKSETDEAELQAFLETLAGIALAVARRKADQPHEEERTG